MAVYTIKSEFATSRRIAQITDTIEFEFVKNVKKLIILGLIAAVVFILNIAIQTLDVSRGIKLPTNPTDYITSYLGYFNFLTVIITITIGGSSIATEFEKLTGNVLFPKISRERLLAGRFIGMAIQTVIIITFYYLLVAIAVLANYATFPIQIWYSLGWADLYGITVLSFVVFLSSFLKSTAATVILAIFILIIAYEIIIAVMSLVGTTEPLFILTYYENIITNIFNMPDPRYLDNTIAAGGQSFTLRTWYTPSWQGALIGLLLQCGIFLGLAFLIFKYRQMKQ